MQPIPNTGGGFSGFLAHGLWHVYRHFPSPGRWDWLFLILCLAVVTRALFVPYVWKCVKADMANLRSRKISQANQSMVPVLWDIGLMWFLVWFFHGEAGRTLLEGRCGIGSALPSETHRGLFWACLVVCTFLPGIMGGLEDRVKRRNQMVMPSSPQPYPDRGFLSLYGGGGVFFEGGERGPKIEESVRVVVGEAAAIAFAHWVYWYWSVVSEFLFIAFLLTAVATEAVRMLFVYILHKRTFG